MLNTMCKFTYIVCNFTREAIFALLIVKFSGLKMCECKKNDKYQVWSYSVSNRLDFTVVTFFTFDTSLSV